MRLQDQVRKCVVYIGHARPNDDDNIDAIATGFLIEHQGGCYLVTCAHVVHELEDSPLGIRLNDQDRRGRVDRIEMPHWVRHPTDETIDVAVMRYNIPTWVDYDAWITKWFVTESKRESKNIGAGDLAYIVGLYRNAPGVGRIAPIVHTGHVAMMEDDEKIPAADWRNDDAPQVPISAYLVEAQTLDGLSGSPVFVRRSLFTRVNIPALDPNPLNATLHGTVWFLGLWRGAWFGPPDTNVQLPRNALALNPKIPTGMGIVVPASQIIEVLDYAAQQPVDLVANT